jgi:hypothetical protein
MRDRIQRKSMPANHAEHDTPSPAVAEASLNPAFSGHDFANISVFPKDSVSQQESVQAQESGLSSETEVQKLTPDRSRQFGSDSRPSSGGHDFSGMNIFPTQPENRTGLPDQVLQRMENAFGHDFSQIRTQESAEPEKLSALAFARGNDLHFRPGAFDPHSQTGLSMIGHELAHVVQQRQGRARGAGGAVLEDAGLESEAQVLGARAAGGGVVNLDTALWSTAPQSLESVSVVQRFKMSDLVVGRVYSIRYLNEEMMGKFVSRTKNDCKFKLDNEKIVVVSAESDILDITTEKWVEKRHSKSQENSDSEVKQENFIEESETEQKILFKEQEEFKENLDIEDEQKEFIVNSDSELEEKQEEFIENLDKKPNERQEKLKENLDIEQEKKQKKSAKKQEENSNLSIIDQAKSRLLRANNRAENRINKNRTLTASEEFVTPFGITRRSPSVFRPEDPMITTRFEEYGIKQNESNKKMPLNYPGIIKQVDNWKDFNEKFKQRRDKSKNNNRNGTRKDRPKAMLFSTLVNAESFRFPGADKIAASAINSIAEGKNKSEGFLDLFPMAKKGTAKGGGGKHFYKNVLKGNQELTEKQANTIMEMSSSSEEDGNTLNSNKPNQEHEAPSSDNENEEPKKKQKK